jgi:hypothetical protein
MNDTNEITESYPHVTLDLLRHLFEKFPLEAFKACRNEGDLRRLQGAHDVIDWLDTVYQLQNAPPSV